MLEIEIHISDGEKPRNKLAVPHQSPVPASRPRLSGPALCTTRISIHNHQRCIRSARLRLRICHTHNDGREHRHQVRPSLRRPEQRDAVGQQGGFPALHRASHGPDQGHPLPRVRGHNGQDLHAAPVRFPTHVLHG